MKYLPHDRRAIIYLNALEEANSKHNSDSQLLKIPHLESWFQDFETNPRPADSHDERLADLGMQISHAIIEDRQEDADRLSSNYSQLAASHPASAVLQEVPSFIREHSIPGYAYRNWRGTPKGLSFGMIQAQLDDNATIGIIGDWGTGDPDAQALLQELKDKHNPDIIIHLGDIYRSCRYPDTDDPRHNDVVPHFINIIDAVYPPVNGKPTRPPILTIPGNHDYMSKGGEGFFKLIDEVNIHHPSWTQEASYFCIRTKSQKWQFLGADTGINDPSFHHRNSHPGLEPDEYTWHYDKMKNFAGKGQGRTILMTHHPLFSATHPLEHGKYLNQDLGHHFDGYCTGGSVQPGEIRLWMWGHNHWFIPYKNTARVVSATLDKGRLIGGSARHDYHSTPRVVNATLDKGRLISGSARHDYHSCSEIVNSGRHVITYNRNGQDIPLVPDSNNGLPNHSYTVIKLSDRDAEITHYQTPSWHPDDTDPVKQLPHGQHHVLLREYVLDTKPAQKYPGK